MANSGTVYTNEENVRSHKIFIAAQYSGADVKRASDFVLGETNKSADYLSQFPCGSVPGFKTSDNKCLSDSKAIAYYVSNADLRGGQNDYDRACVVQWSCFAESELSPCVTVLGLDKMGVQRASGKDLEKATAVLNHSLAILDDYLRTRTYLVGERVTLADISCYTALLLAYKYFFDSEYEKKYINVCRWFNTCVNQPQAKCVLGEVKLGTSLKEERKAIADKKKEEQRKLEAAEAGEDEPPKKPETDPFAAFPAGTFKMDEWKRTYSNNDIIEVALPYFWTNFDKTNYSMWFAEYKYPADLAQVFMTCNLVTGMYQRLDRMRKHAFGVMSIYGVSKDNTITGLFVWRSHELAFKLSEDLQVDYESYDWRKVDPDSDEAKQLVKDYFGRNKESEFKGKKFNQCFVFK